MAALKNDALMVGGGVLLLIGGLWYLKNNMAKVATAAVGVVGDAAAGTVLGIGDALGVPRTSETECEKAMREGRTWDASFACPASTFIDYTINGYIDTTNKGLQ